GIGRQTASRLPYSAVGGRRRTLPAGKTHAEVVCVERLYKSVLGLEAVVGHIRVSRINDVVRDQETCALIPVGGINCLRAVSHGQDSSLRRIVFQIACSKIERKD